MKQCTNCVKECSYKNICGKEVYCGLSSEEIKKQKYLYKKNLALKKEKRRKDIILKYKKFRYAPNVGYFKYDEIDGEYKPNLNYICYPSNSNRQRYLKKASSKKNRRNVIDCKKGNSYKKNYEYKWLLY